MTHLNQQTITDLSPDSTTITSGLTAFESIIERHSIDAAFLWLQRSQIIYSSTLYNQNDIRNIDQRLNAHLEVLHSSGQLGWNICSQQLELHEVGEAFVAGVIAFLSRDEGKIQQVCDTVLANDEMMSGLISAIGWVNESIITDFIENCLTDPRPEYQYIGVASHSVIRKDPEAALSYLLQDPDIQKNVDLYSRLLRLIGEIKRADLHSYLDQAMKSDDFKVKFWATWSAVILGDLNAVDNLKEYLLSQNAYTDEALQVVFNSLTPDQSMQWINDLTKDEDINQAQIRIAIKATAILGDIHAIPWLIEQMKKTEYSRLAGLSFSLITSVDLQHNKLYQDIDIGFKEKANGEIEDDAENIDIDLPWPDAMKVHAFWDQNSSSFDSDKQYFMGQIATSESLREILSCGNQLQRFIVAMKITMLETSTKLINIAASTVKV